MVSLEYWNTPGNRTDGAHKLFIGFACDFPCLTNFQLKVQRKLKLMKRKKKFMKHICATFYRTILLLKQKFAFNILINKYCVPFAGREKIHRMQCNGSNLW